jgi:hypothetical protein
MRALGGAGLIFTGVVLLFTGWGAFAGILLIVAGIVLWGWGLVGSQQDESLDKAIIDPNEQSAPESESGSSGLIDPNEGNRDPDDPVR